VFSESKDRRQNGNFGSRSFGFVICKESDASHYTQPQGNKNISSAYINYKFVEI